MMATPASAKQRCLKLASPRDLYPPEVGAYVLNQAPGEPRLWPAKAVEGYTERLRMLDMGLPPSTALFVRLDTNVAGQTTGHLVRLTVDDEYNWTVSERRQFSVPAGSMKNLDSLVRQADLGNVQFYGKEEEPCADGRHTIVERATSAGYGFAAGNLWCQKNPPVEAIVTQMRSLAGVQ